LTPRSNEHGTHVGQLADDLPHPALVQPLHNSAVLLEEEGQGTEAQLSLDEQLSVLLPGILELDHVGIGLLRQVSQDVDFLKVTQPGVSFMIYRQPNYSPILDAVKHSSCLLDSIQPIAISILHLDYSAKSALAEVVERDEPFLKQVVLFRQIRGCSRVRLSVMERAMLLRRSERRKRQSGIDAGCRGCLDAGFGGGRRRSFLLGSDCYQRLSLPPGHELTS
jgi:hypothetical protein